MTRSERDKLRAAADLLGEARRHARDAGCETLELLLALVIEAGAEGDLGELAAVVAGWTLAKRDEREGRN